MQGLMPGDKNMGTYFLSAPQPVRITHRGQSDSLCGRYVCGNPVLLRECKKGQGREKDAANEENGEKGEES